MAAARDWEARWTAQARIAPARADNAPAAKGLRDATFVYTKSWRKPRARRYVKRTRERSGFKGSCSNIRYLGLFPLFIHADEGIKP